MIVIQNIEEKFREYFSQEIIDSLEMEVLFTKIEAICKQGYFDNENEVTDKQRLEEIFRLCREIHFEKTDHHPYHVKRNKQYNTIRQRNVVYWEPPESAYPND